MALEFTNFIGRFHPLLVHLPIGFILLAILLEWWESFRKTKKSSRLIPIAWIIGGLATILAAFCGWFLGETGLYEEGQIFWHRWLGIALIPIAFAGWWLKKKAGKFSALIQNGFNILIIVLLSIEGHKGGNLTHGEDYLMEYAPETIQKVFAAEKNMIDESVLNNPDSVLVYADLIQPIFNAKCVSCHGKEVQRGGLNMSHSDSLQLGGDGGLVVIAGNTEESELFKRVTLSQDNIKFMPPTRRVLTYDEIKILEWWINQGASFESSVNELEVKENMKPVLLRQYGLNTEPRPWYEKVQIQALDSMQITTIAGHGFKVRTLGGANPLLDVSYSGTDLTQEKIAALEVAKKHITWLSLTDTNVENEWLLVLSGFSNLTRLELDKTRISDEGIIHLAGLSHLEALNLYASQVSNISLPILQELPDLKRVYLSRTKVTVDKANDASDKKEDLTIIIDAHQ